MNTTTILRPMLSLEQVLEFVPVSKATIKRWVKDGLFPRPRKLSANRVAWYREDIEVWQAALTDDPVIQSRWRKKTGLHVIQPK